ncbi:MAG TPA: glycosyltransferase family 4 protein, partial [Gaiellaceae bacterium]|nr:glycosyltransferase family 4 protein [Gaiellaceae bacterium]
GAPLMRVVHVHRIAGIGGSERHLLALLPALARLGVEPALVGLDVPGPSPEPFYARLAAAGVPCVRVPAPRSLDPLLPARLRRALRSLTPDVVHTHLVHADVYGALAAGRTPLVTTKHNDDPFRTGPFRLVERALALRARRVIVITDALARFTVEQVGIPAAKVTTIHYGLDELPDAWGPNPVVELPAGARVLLAVGRLVPQKGLEVAVAALPTVRERHPDAVLVVLGEGPERARLEARSRQLGVADAVFLPGRAGDVAAWLRQAEVLVHPARWEGFGLVLLEAMLASRPVVAAHVSAVPEVVRDRETGLLVPPDDPAALAAALNALLGDRELSARYGTAGLARARAKFSVARMAERTLAVYRASPAAARTASAHGSTE